MPHLTVFPQHSSLSLSLYCLSSATKQLGGHLRRTLVAESQEWRRQACRGKANLLQSSGWRSPSEQSICSFSESQCLPSFFPTHIGHPLLNSLPGLLDRKFMFLLCNVILIFISGDSLLVIKELPYSKRKLDVYDDYIIKKNELSLTQVSHMVGVPKSSATKMVLLEKKVKDAESESKAIVVAGGGGGEEEELILDGLEREEEEEHFREEDRRFDEFIARGKEIWRREQQQLLNCKAKESRKP